MAEPASARAVPPSFSLIIPTRNEAEDIRHTLERCLALDYDRKEIIVVDDSSDETPRIVSEYAARGVRLIHREENVDGCCGARNAGMRAAPGSVSFGAQIANVMRATSGWDRAADRTATVAGWNPWRRNRRAPSRTRSRKEAT